MNILIVDDDKNICYSLSWVLRREDHTVVCCYSGEDALATLDKEIFGLVFLDVKMPGMGGLVALEKMVAKNPTLKIIMISGAADITLAVRATKLGAYNFLEKPLNQEKVLLEVENLRKQEVVTAQVQNLQEMFDQEYHMIGNSPAMQQLFQTIQKAAPSEGRILIYGENGTGKELVAREIHKRSLRANRSFVQLNCAAIPRELIESELFGYEKGAFTGASQRKLGLIEKAQGGTLLLDEVGDMAMETQAKLLRVLQENEFYRVGGTNACRFDVRIISATNKDLEKEIATGTFRQDLFFRLDVIPIQVPPLRNHKEDIPALSTHFLANYCQRNGKKNKQIAEDAITILLRYHWPGNIRELKNTMERLAIMHEEDIIDATAVQSILSLEKIDHLLTKPTHPNLSIREQLQLYEKSILEKGIQKYRGNISHLAAALKIDRANLHRKLKQFGIKTGKTNV